MIVQSIACHATRGEKKTCELFTVVFNFPRKIECNIISLKSASIFHRRWSYHHVHQFHHFAITLPSLCHHFASKVKKVKKKSKLMKLQAITLPSLCHHFAIMFINSITLPSLCKQSEKVKKVNWWNCHHFACKVKKWKSEQVKGVVCKEMSSSQMLLIGVLCYQNITRLLTHRFAMLSSLHP